MDLLTPDCTKPMSSENKTTRHYVIEKAIRSLSKVTSLYPENPAKVEGQIVAVWELRKLTEFAESALLSRSQSGSIVRHSYPFYIIVTL